MGQWYEMVWQIISWKFLTKVICRYCTDVLIIDIINLCIQSVMEKWANTLKIVCCSYLGNRNNNTYLLHKCF